MTTYKRCYEHNGIEIYFDGKPSVAVRDELKANGWRWHRTKMCWYHYYSSSNMNFAMKLCNSPKAEKRSYSSFDEWPEESTLRKYGYSVSRENGLNRMDRWNIIISVIKHGVMTYKEVTDFLEAMISLHEKNDSKDYDTAIARWSEDLEFTYMLKGLQSGSNMRIG